MAHLWLCAVVTKYNVVVVVDWLLFKLKVLADADSPLDIIILCSQQSVILNSTVSFCAQPTNRKFRLLHLMHQLAASRHRHVDRTDITLSKTSYIYAADLSNCHTLDYKDPSHQGSRIRSVRILVFEGYVRTLINVFYFSVYVNKNRIEYVATTTQ